MPPFKRYYTVSVPVGVFWKIVVPAIVLVSVLAMCAGVFFIDEFVMPRVVGIERDMVEVPDVKGLLLDQGREKCYGAGLLTELRSRDYDSNVPEDAIISQMPAPGSKVKKGRRISVVVSRGKEFAVIPDVKNMTERQARMELKRRGFLLGEIKKIFHDKQQAETAIDAFPKSGSTVSRDMKVDLIISKGPKPTSAEMPNIVGESLTEAKKKIDMSGMRVGTINYRSNPSLLPGTVIAQSVSPGDNVPLGTPVDMTVSIIQ
jgi:beta-lactam-binding protein with PASTA domain